MVHELVLTFDDVDEGDPPRVVMVDSDGEEVMEFYDEPDCDVDGGYSTDVEDWDAPPLALYVVSVVNALAALM